MAITSSSLFHFTGKNNPDPIQIICSILKNGFIPKYNREIKFDCLADNRNDILNENKLIIEG